MSSRRRRRTADGIKGLYPQYKLTGVYSSGFIRRLSNFLGKLNSNGIAAKLDFAYLLGLNNLVDSSQNLISSRFPLISYSGFSANQGAVAPWSIEAGYSPLAAGAAANRNSFTFGAYLNSVAVGRNANLISVNSPPNPRCYFELNPGAPTEYTGLVNSDAMFTSPSAAAITRQVLSINRASAANTTFRIGGGIVATDSRGSSGNFSGENLRSFGTISGNILSFLYGGSFLTDSEEQTLNTLLNTLFL